jgi:DUF1680 family protein
VLSRRRLLATASALALAGPIRAATTQATLRARPLPMNAVRLKPSPWRDAVEANRLFLLSLEPDRLLHNFHVSAGLEPKGEVYGGWEARGIAGHSLGHYLSACSLMFAQTGDGEVRARAAYVVAELARCQAAHGDGYVGGTTVERGGKVVDGKIVYEEIRKGEIRTGGFDINGGWVPLYTWHKVQAGLIDAHRHAGVEGAMPVLLGMAGYLATILEGLDESQMQKLLACEHGGLNEAYADTYALTGNPRWLRLAERIRDRRVLDPLTERKDILPGLHANTQIPKLIGLARLHELDGDPRHATAARFFFDIVTRHHSYVIGGNSEREHFGPPDTLSTRITDRTCEGCNSYNMLKLARHLYGWRPDAALFDFYERVHLNHILAQQHPKTGMFAYFMPLAAGARRTWSTRDDSFWCCVGSGMESHAKHGDSIYWEDGSRLFVNLYIPSTLDWRERGLKLDLDTDFPDSQTVTLTVAAARRRVLALALRLPGWCEHPRIALNGRPAAFAREGGYAVLTRAWRAGDRLELILPMRLKVEPTPDDPRVIAFSHGPVVLAADLGPAAKPFDRLPPALVGTDPAKAMNAVDPVRHLFRIADAKPEPLVLKPYFSRYDDRTAVYFPIFTPAQWAGEETAFVAAQRARAALEKRTVDVIQLGEMQPERDHDFASNHSDLLAWGGRSGRQAWWGIGNYIEFSLAVRPGPMILQALYWGEETDKNFTIRVEGEPIATERRPGPPVKAFVTADYPIPERLTQGRSRIRIRFETRGSDAPVYECRLLAAGTVEA